jgi:hypothetical protein
MAKRSPGRDAPFHAVRMRMAGMKLGACMAVGDIQVIIPDGMKKDDIVKALAQIAAAVESDGKANTPGVFIADVLIIVGDEMLSIIKREALP